MQFIFPKLYRIWVSFLLQDDKKCLEDFLIFFQSRNLELVLKTRNKVLSNYVQQLFCLFSHLINQRSLSVNCIVILLRCNM